MGRDSAISWCRHTFNWWWGCTKIAAGCTNCYAAAFDKRVGGDHWTPGGPRRFFGEKHWNDPLRWQRAAAKAGEQHRVFCGSMMDWAEDHPDPEIRAQMAEASVRGWKLIEQTPNLTWLMLTKRVDAAGRLPWTWVRDGAPRNLWYGTTVENREHGLPRLEAARKVKCAARRLLSIEPLLEDLGELDLTGIDWVIAGCESGPRARPCQVDWLRSIRDQCAAQGVAFWLKQATTTSDANGGGYTITDIRPVPQVLGRIGELIPVVGVGQGSKEKPRGVIELPYLDGVQHAAVPS